MVNQALNYLSTYVLELLGRGYTLDQTIALAKSNPIFLLLPQDIIVAVASCPDLVRAVTLFTS